MRWAHPAILEARELVGDVTRAPLQRARQRGVIPVTWDAEKRQFVVALRGFVLQKTPDPEAGVDICFKPPVLYDVRIRKAGSRSSLVDRMRARQVGP